HPCALCAQVSLAKQAEEKKEQPPAALLAKKKSEPFPSLLAIAPLFPPSVSVSWPRGDLSAALRSDRPPVPPPPSRLS
ncbi:MAG TPA: hypothetical protein VIM58_06990, partial [Candidatus Methylacidiphilales bacterium]